MSSFLLLWIPRLLDIEAALNDGAFQIV